MNKGDRVIVEFSTDGYQGQRATVMGIDERTKLALVQYDNLHFGWPLIANCKPIQESTDGVANAAFTKPDNGEDCR